MDGVYVIFILMVHHMSVFIYFYILEELYLMLHIFIILILGFLKLLFTSSQWEQHLWVMFYRMDK